MLAAVRLAVLTLIGHAALWVGAINRLHAISAPRWLIDSLSWCCRLLLIGLPIAAIVLWRFSEKPIDVWLSDAIDDRALRLYLLPCSVVALVTIWLWIERRLGTWRGVVPQRNHTQILDIAATLGCKPASGFKAQLLLRVPGNQVLQLAVREKQLWLVRLPIELDGLSIAHFSDLHITGRIGIDYFHEVIDRVEALRADLIAVTGDVIDEIEHSDWLKETLGRLTAPLGAYFVLGNHDQFAGKATAVRQALSEAGLTDLGGRWQRVDSAGGELILAGNERPWFRLTAEMGQIPPKQERPPQLRILLAHSPDQFAWAQRRDFDLVLAGHTHGGQICVPLIGPIHCPSLHGVKYASGVFFEQPTVMHVSRGVSSELPIRLNCRPEVTKLVLRAGIRPPENR
jgi:predicted MPP superfamily phosphohydrolase